MTDIPTLATDRLILRPPVMADYPAYCVLMASSRAVHIGGPFDSFATWGLFCHDLAQWALFGHGALMIDLRACGVCVGQVGINHGPLFPEKELGWLLYDGHEGHGYAVEAAGALRNWAFDARGLPTLVSYINAANLASIAVAERLGAKPDPTASRPDPEVLVYRHSR